MKNEKYDPAIHGRPNDHEAARRRLMGLPAPPRNDHKPRHDRPPFPPPGDEFDPADRYKMGHEIRPGVFCDRPLGHVLAGIVDECGQPDPEEDEA